MENFKEAAIYESRLAQFHIGVLYEQGWGTPLDANETIVRFKKAGDKGDVRSQHDLGVLYFDGKNGVEQEYQQALHYFLMAAEQSNDANSQNYIGIMYFKVSGIDVHEKGAVDWFSKAAN
jgi:TPR repeat protein